MSHLLQRDMIWIKQGGRFICLLKGFGDGIHKMALVSLVALDIRHAKIQGRILR